MSSQTVDPQAREAILSLARRLGSLSIRAVEHAARERAKAARAETVRALTAVADGTDTGRTYMSSILEAATMDPKPDFATCNPLVWARLARDLGVTQSDSLSVTVGGMPVNSKWTYDSDRDEDSLLVRVDGTAYSYLMAPDGLDHEQGELYIQLREDQRTIRQALVTAQDTIPDRKAPGLAP